ncbi:efflux RND transporter permease subunit [Azospirillum argentinense]
MTLFNPSRWILKHPFLALYFMLATIAAGLFAYGQLGRSEDPPFTFKVMLIQTLWPGATTQETRELVTDRLMRTLQQVPQVDFVHGYSRPGESTIFFTARDKVRGTALQETLYQVRKRVGDARPLLPDGVQGPFFNDEFGDVYVEIYALKGDGFSPHDLHDYANRIRSELLRVEDVAKVDYFGDRPERIYVEPSKHRLAALGIGLPQLAALLGQQNQVSSAGVVDAGVERIALRTDSSFTSVKTIENLVLRIDGRSLRLGDIAQVIRGYQDPPPDSMRFGGVPVLGIGVTMQADGDVLKLGHALAGTIARIQASLPVGLEIVPVVSMPEAVSRSVNEFLRAVAEAVAIVLLVSFLSLGLRAGAVVAINIVLVLAATALAMWQLGIGLHKVSLGSLILALGLLVDDAIIAVEMMAVKLEQGLDRVSAASFAYTSTAFPMLTGTLVTVAGFLPLAIAESSTGEYTRSIFEVSALSLCLSWLAAILAVPFLGYYLLPDKGTETAIGRGLRTMLPARLRPTTPSGHGDYRTPFYDRFRRLVDWCVIRRKRVVALTLAGFLMALAGMTIVPRQFFPQSARPELLVDMRLPEGSSYSATLAEVEKMEAHLARWPQTANYVAFVGSGAPRFFLSLDQQLAEPSFAQFIVTTTGSAAREELISFINTTLDAEFPMVRKRVSRLENGPPVGFPVQFRISGEDIAEIRRIAGRVAEILRADPRTRDTHYDWDEPSKVVRLKIDDEKVRQLGLTSADIAGVLHMSLSGYAPTAYREGDRLIPVELRAPADERVDIAHVGDLTIFTPTGRNVPLSQLVHFSYEIEDGIVRTRDRLPTITVRADVAAGVQPIAVTEDIEGRLATLISALPFGYRIETGGAAESNRMAQASINAGMPLMILVVVTLLMLQLKRPQHVLMVVATAPLGIIGVTAGLLLFDKAFGFVAMLGTIAMFGIVMRNSVILVDQIEQDIHGGASPREAVVEAAVRRLRPIMLTAAAAVLSLIPLIRSDFFGPMAVALMGGITAATLLTMLFVPALYAWWMRVPATPRE